MKSIYYTLKDAHHWAAFSGDYNPIHFDLNWVQAQGLDQLSVHGMRVLLDAKQFASKQICHDVAPNNAYIKCVVRLRNPLWNDKTYHLVTRNKAGSVAVLSAEDQKNSLTCQLSSLNTFDLNDSETMNCLSSDEVAILQSSFAVFSKELYDWQFIDAVMFQYLIHDDALLRQENIATWLPEGTTLKDIFSDYPIVQTHQEIIFESSLLQKWVPAVTPEPIHISIQPSLVIGDIETGLLICIKTIARYKNKLVSNSITLKVNAKSK